MAPSWTFVLQDKLWKVLERKYVRNELLRNASHPTHVLAPEDEFDRDARALHQGSKVPQERVWQLAVPQKAIGGDRGADCAKVFLYGVMLRI